MDEFFDFDGATARTDIANRGSVAEDPSQKFDIDLALAAAGSDEDAFLSLAHFTQEAPDEQIQFDLHQPIPSERDPKPFDTHAWQDDRHITPRYTCIYCQENGFHCQVIKSGDHVGSCTCCIALDRQCSLINDQTTDKDEEYDEEEGEEGSTTLDKMFYQPPSIEGVTIGSANDSATDLNSLADPKSEPLNDDSKVKTGTRFSRESLRILRGWLSSHHRLPYPTDEDKENLRKQTGLTKTQISNWIANARRRGKVRAPRTVSPGSNQTTPIDIPPRVGTPIPRDMMDMNPMQRWQNSPPEHEPASVTAIANAVSSRGSFSSQLNSNYGNGDSDTSAPQSVCNTSSFGASGSSGDSFASAFSYESRGSFGSFAAKGRRRKGQRRQITKQPIPKFAMIPNPQPPRKFQCTFCTESFKTKHDWQRHEKSLHLSLERWVCAPHGPVAICNTTNEKACAFCESPTITGAHMEYHNYSVCADKSLDERTFYRKDHLRQHLLLVHDCKFNAWSMDSWRAETPVIKSRCGFCDMTLDSWAQRVDHLTKHFKSGKGMSEWKGDWGFENHVLAIIENAMPPYLIHFDRNTPRPYKASKENPESLRQPYDLVKVGLIDFLNEKTSLGEKISDSDLIKEARQMYKSLDGAAKGRRYSGVSWIRDLFMAETTYIGPKNTDRPLIDLQTNPGCGMGRCCPYETQLREFVDARTAIGSPPSDSDLQAEACRILTDAEKRSSFPSEPALAWFCHLINSSTEWLTDFKARMSISPEQKMPQFDTLVDTLVNYEEDQLYDIYNIAHLEAGLRDYINLCAAMGVAHTTDDDLQRQARIIIFGVDDPQFNTEADQPAWLAQFKRKFDQSLMLGQEPAITLPNNSDQTGTITNSYNALSLPNSDSLPLTPPYPSPDKSLHWDLSVSPPTDSIGDPGSGSVAPLSVLSMFSPLSSSNTHEVRHHTAFSRVSLAPLARVLLPEDSLQAPQFTNPIPCGSGRLYAATHLGQRPVANPMSPTPPLEPRRYFFSDANCYRRLMYELSRYVASCMSPNNPDSHVPTDEEIQRQSRWILYDDDDPWNQTAADNEEWLRRFKRDVGLIGKDENTGLGLSELVPWMPGASGSSAAKCLMSNQGFYVDASEQAAGGMGRRT